MQGVPSKFTLRISAKLIPLVKVFFTRLGIYYMWMCIVFSVREKEVHKHALLLLLIFFLVVGFRKFERVGSAVHSYCNKKSDGCGVKFLRP
jgi:hypothetical protein